MDTRREALEGEVEHQLLRGTGHSLAPNHTEPPSRMSSTWSREAKGHQMADLLRPGVPAGHLHWGLRTTESGMTLEPGTTPGSAVVDPTRPGTGAFLLISIQLSEAQVG